MISRSTILHLRIPFSLYLLPFFCFALSQSPKPDWVFIIISFIAIHLFFYPSSNGYNSYYDKDEESIGGLEKPPPVSKELLIVAVIFEAISIALALIVSVQFALMIFCIAMVSRAYSHPSIRLKKYPILGLFTVALFQGAYTFFMSFIAISGIEITQLTNPKIIWAGSLCTFMLLGSYPMTQIYQHGEDGRRGDRTMSRMLGIQGTFIWTGLVFFITTVGFVLYFYFYHSLMIAILFPIFLFPTLIYFSVWFLKVRKSYQAADFKSTMRLNAISSLSFIAFFIFLWIHNIFMV